MSKHLFENPAIVYVGLAFIEVILLIVWRRRRTKQAARWLIAPVAGAVLVGLLAWLVVTDREYIVSACSQMADDLSSGRVDAVETYLDDQVRVDLGEYGESNMSKAMAVAKAEWFINGQVRHIAVTDFTVTVKRGAAAVGITTVVHVSDQESGLNLPLRLHWPTDWAKRDAGWRITEVHAPKQQKPGQ